jgi:hypothetical protein
MKFEMPRKPKMTVTSRFVDEQPPLASRNVPSPFPNPPPNRSPIGRLWFRGPSPKLDWSAAELAHAIGVASLRDAVVFLDTNIFTTDYLDKSVWDALFTRRLFITPNVFKELLPWLKNPFRNKAVRDRVLAALKNQVNAACSSQESAPFQQLPSSDIPKIEVLFLNEDFTNHGYDYYLRLLALRKAMGQAAANILTRQLGQSPTNDQFLAEIQSNLGRRGFLIAKKGLEAANSPNKLTDEHLVVMAVLTAIMRGTEVFIVTRDPDVLEQYYKLLCLMKEHYRAMLVAERYAASPESMPFREVPIESDGVQPPRFSGSSILELETTDVEFNPLPAKFHFVNIYCLLLGGGPSEMKVTSCCFCAETEMAQMLRVKTITGGLSTDKFDGRNCTIHTVPFTPETSKVIVSIGKDTMLPPGKSDGFRMDDLLNTLYENEKRTLLSIR